MKSNTIKLLAILIMSVNANLLSAQTPSLSVNGNANSGEVYLKVLDIKVDIVGGISTTSMTMTFQNKTSKILEGELTFPLPEGVTVSGYALDINGKMRKAVPVDKAKGTQVFEEIERRRVDPGLLERVEGNNFRTRIYPIPGNGARTVTITYEEELAVVNNQLAYRLPMDYKTAIEQFSLKASVWENAGQPKVEGGMADDITFDKRGKAYVSTFNKANYTPKKILSFSLPVSKAAQVLMQPASGSNYFLANYTPKQDNRAKKWGGTIGVIWDASLSGKERNIEREFEVLETIINKNQNLSIKLAFLNNTFTEKGTFEIKKGNWDVLKSVLENAVYDGGTNFSAINIGLIPADEYILFSDGMSTLSDADFTLNTSANKYISYFNKTGKKPAIHCVVSAPKADYSALKWIASKTNAKFVNLNSSTTDEVKTELLNESLQFIGIKNNSALSEVYPSVATDVKGRFSIAGISNTNKTSITLQFGYGNTVTEEKVLVLDAANSSTTDLDVYKVWAQKKVAELDMQYEKNKEDLLELAQQFGIVTRNTSLIVLENLSDYIQYEITPPAELLAEFNNWRKNRFAQQAQREKNLLEGAKASFSDLKKWWDTEFKVKEPKFPQPDNSTDDMPPPPPPSPNRNVDEDASVYREDILADDEMSSEALMDEVVVVGYGVARDKNMSAVSEKKVAKQKVAYAPQKQAKIIRTELKQDAEYLKSLTGNLKEDYKAYLKQRETYGTTPTFYFDMANWFFAKGDRAKALTILTSVAELNIENAGLFRLLAYRLKEYREHNLEVYICKKVVDWRPMEPQSYRDYALALKDNREPQKALDVLYSAITQNFAGSVLGISAGIEEVLVTELNQMISMQKLNTDSIDKSLIAEMPVDVRVVINWNMPNTDIDLHVTDPRGEMCFFGHKRTEMGGRISNDITRGFGPEQFMLKRAIKGTYKIEINYYGDSQVKAEGPATIMAEIYTSYSNKEEKREVVCFQLSKESRGKVQIAEFQF